VDTRNKTVLIASIPCIRDQPIYQPGRWPIFGFYRYIGIGQNSWFSVGVDKTLLYSSCIQTTCARKHNEASQTVILQQG